MFDKLSKEDIESIKLGAELHDIGKIGVPDSILNKSGKLTAEEYEIIKKHTEIGYEIVSNFPHLNEIIAEIILHRHEKYDGTGYPNGLAGENIPFAARVIAITDSYHAMISDRPYRKGLSKENAVKLLREGAGKQWDPFLVSKFIDMINSKT